MNYLYSEITQNFIGCVYQVVKLLPTCLERNVYLNALKIELENEKIEFQFQQLETINYKGQKVGENKFDFIIDGKVGIIITNTFQLERKTDITEQSILFVESTLRTSELEVILLINFGREIEHRRFYLSNELKRK
jgi:GxxExxY protein